MVGPIYPLKSNRDHSWYSGYGFFYSWDQVQSVWGEHGKKLKTKNIASYSAETIDKSGSLKESRNKTHMS